MMKVLRPKRQKVGFYRTNPVSNRHSAMKLWEKIFLLTTAIAIGMTVVLKLGAAGTNNLSDLDHLVAQINREPASAIDPLRVADLSKQFGVPMGRINMMQRDKNGWGTITAELALARSLSRRQPKVYLTPTEALARIQWLREGEFSYNEIADKCGNRNDIVEAVNRSDPRHHAV
jgi:hypothetical protein